MRGDILTTAAAGYANAAGTDTPAATPEGAFPH